jgi:hypothetical protein
VVRSTKYLAKNKVYQKLSGPAMVRKYYSYLEQLAKIGRIIAKERH